MWIVFAMVMISLMLVLKDGGEKCAKCSGSNCLRWKDAGKTQGGVDLRVCDRCGHEQLSEDPMSGMQVGGGGE